MQGCSDLTHITVSNFVIFWDLENIIIILIFQVYTNCFNGHEDM